MRDRFTGLLSLVVPPLLLTLMATAAYGETWTDTTGKFSIEATFVKVEGRSVVLRKADGSSVTVPIDRLSDTSRATAKRLYEAQAAGVPGIRPGQPNGQADLRGANYPINGTLEQAAVYLSDEMRKGNFAIIYLMIPKNMRDAADTQDIQQELAVTISNYDRAAQTTQAAIDQLIKLLVTKKKFLLNSQLKIKMTPEVYNHFVTHYDSVVGFLKAGRNMLAERSSLANQPMSVFFQKHMNQIGSHAAPLFFGLPELAAEMNLPDSGKITQTGNRGEIDFGESEEISRFRLVGGYWVQEGLADLDEELGGVHTYVLAELKAFNQLPVDPKVFLIAGMLDGLFSGAIQPMLEAKNQIEFNLALQNATLLYNAFSELGEQPPQ